MILSLTDSDVIKMKEVVLDGDRDEALKLVRELIKRLDQQKNAGLKSHLDR